MRFAALFLWLVVPLSIWLAISLFGTPHVIGTYRFYDNGDRYNPYAPRRYIDCTYYGWSGTHTVSATNGACPWVRFFKGADQ